MFLKELNLKVFTNKVQNSNYSSIDVNALVLKLLGFLTGLPFVIFSGFYLSHISILILFLYKNNFNKKNLFAYLFFIIICTYSTLFNSLNSLSLQDFRFSNFINTIILYSVVLIKYSKEDFRHFFKGILISYSILFLLIVLNFRLDIFSNGFFSFFVTGRDWAENLGFFGNSFAIYSIIICFILYKTYNPSILVLILIIIVAVLTTSRLSLFGILLLVQFIFIRFNKKYRYLLFLIFLVLLIYFFLQINLSEVDGYDMFSSRFEYVDDRVNLTTIAKQLFLKHPIIGNGPIYLEKYTFWEPHLHNLWFDIAIGYGIFATLLYFLLFFIIIKNFIIQTKEVIFIFFILVSSYTQISLKEPYIGLLLFMYLNTFDIKNSINKHYINE
jgi:O-antigen ligase